MCVCVWLSVCVCTCVYTSTPLHRHTARNTSPNNQPGPANKPQTQPRENTWILHGRRKPFQKQQPAMLTVNLPCWEATPAALVDLADELHLQLLFDGFCVVSGRHAVLCLEVQLKHQLVGDGNQRAGVGFPAGLAGCKKHAAVSGDVCAPWQAQRCGAWGGQAGTEWKRNNPEVCWTFGINRSTAPTGSYHLKQNEAYSTCVESAVSLSMYIICCYVTFVQCFEPSNWILTSCQPQRIISGQSNCHKQIHILKLFSSYINFFSSQSIKPVPAQI